MQTMAANTVSLQQVRIQDAFWSKYETLIRDTVLPYQWKALNDELPDTEPSYAIHNFQVAAGLKEGEFGGMVFQDSDLAKWLEAVAYSLATHPDAALEQLADEAIDLIVRAQQPDGYLNTYFTIKEPDKRWTNIQDCHELYCAGHMMEAAVAYYQATGKRALLDAMCKFADYIDTVFGPEAGKIQGYPGHQEIELALVKLYHVTGETRYLQLSAYFINQRGQSPSFFIEEWTQRGGVSHWSKGPTPKPDLKYNQSHLPVREQSEAVGHAVRAVYMYTAMADLARLTGDQSLLDACRRLWDDISKRQMYITGGIGSTHHGEAFSFAYDLPNDTVYAETCASVGLIFFAFRMLQMEAKREYADVIERALYNLIIGSMTLDGQRYFYVNPLEVWPEASEKNPGRRHVRPVRQKWFGCSCCPPNLARLIASLGQYIYTVDKRTLYTHLFIGSEIRATLDDVEVHLKQTSLLPWDGQVQFTLSLAAPKCFALAWRIPGWCANAQLQVNGEAYPLDGQLQNGYVIIDRVWQNGDRIELNFPMTAQLIQANPQIRADAGKVAIQRGPLVYCFEEADNGDLIAALALSRKAELQARFDASVLGGTVVIEGEGWREDVSAWHDELYRPITQQPKPVHIRAIPYHLWGNRGSGEMAVWLPVQ
ncbi:glycoside hydrolase family 127 protein [Alicyclobacillus fodiniaquatilis]|uniref:Glycoside hydrolase family 127 protein n=1 Tax=Alicyclobacillus fodiniaquatilis TaxID=1661150 RepID=A0ABW4JF42_9BACL